MAIKISNLQQISNLYSQKSYYYKDLHLDIAKGGSFSTVVNQKIENSDIEIDYDAQAIRNSLKNLINTKPGQRFLFPLYGLDLSRHLFEPITEPNGQLIGEKIVKAIRTFEPRVTIKRCQIEAVPDDNQYNITVILGIPILNLEFPLSTILDVRRHTFIFI